MYIIIIINLLLLFLTTPVVKIPGVKNKSLKQSRLFFFVLLLLQI